MNGTPEAFNRFRKTFQAGDMIFSEYEPGDNFYLIQIGRVQIVKIFGDLEKTIAVLNPGEIFGEMSLIDAGPRSATVKALTDTGPPPRSQVIFEFPAKRGSARWKSMP